MKDIVLCLYCGELRPRGREHVLQSALGGNLTLPDVCDDCNNSFSAIDRALAESLDVGIARAAKTPTSMPVRLGGEHFLREAHGGLMCDAKVGNQMVAELFPQLHWTGKADVSFSCADRKQLDEFFELLEHLKKKGQLEDSYVKITDAKFMSVPRMVMDRENRVFVRAANMKEGAELVRFVDQNLALLRSTLGAGTVFEEKAKPTVHVTSRYVPNDVNRAAAKSIFNYVASVFGVLFARSSEFDAVRDYIRGINVLSPVGLDGAGITQDMRFVRKQFSGGFLNLARNKHAIHLLSYDGNLVGLLSLYGHHDFLVTLGKKVPHDFVPVGHEFSLDRTQNRRLAIEEMNALLRDAPLGAGDPNGNVPAQDCESVEPARDKS